MQRNDPSNETTVEEFSPTGALFSSSSDENNSLCDAFEFGLNVWHVYVTSTHGGTVFDTRNQLVVVIVS